MIEKRAHSRHPFATLIGCEAANGVSFVARSRDISVGGMFIDSDERLPFGTEIELVVELPGLGETRLPAIVRWADTAGFGVQFGLLGAKQTHAITEILRRAGG